ncbi:MAG: hypothetical protein EPN97_18425 [Alphaproteobacteria bacterium]|nr:MAG: hypothetical protein EPN97_18425 [Alphaproteobacteria bacterium]
MSRRRPFKPLRRPVFVGCEGESECGYASRVQDILREADVPVHLIIEDLGQGAGDPLSRVEMAVRKLEHLRKTRGAPSDRFVLLDHDQTAADPQRAIKACQLAVAHNIQIVWQRPCFEAVLLRHLAGCVTRRPPDTTESERALKREWPEYEKPMNRSKFAAKIGRAEILQAATVEPELDAMLRSLGVM